MKLQGVHEHTVYATRYRTLLAETDHGFDPVGGLPLPDSGYRGLIARLKTQRGWKRVLERVVGRFPSVNVWRFDDDVAVASADRWLFASDDAGTSWRPTLQLPGSSGPMGVLPTGVCAHDGAIYVGEYPLSLDAAPSVKRSMDGGHSWETVLTLPDVRHVHALRTDPYSGDLWMATGDLGDECRIGRIDGGVFEPIGGGGQRWRTVDLAFTPDAIIWGVDSVYSRTNPVYRLPRDAVGDGDAAESVCDAGGSVYYSETARFAGSHWVVLSTAVEPGTDSTGPENQVVHHSGRARVLAASDRTGYRQWHELAAFEKRSVPVDRWRVGGRIPPANAYLFLASDSARGLFVNPYNTARWDGRIVVFPPRYFAALENGAGSQVPEVVQL